MTGTTVRDGSGLAPDRQLPARDVLLDPEAVAERLPRVLNSGPDLRIGTCELVRVKYRVDQSLRTVYRLGIGAETRLLTARLFPGDRSRAAYERAVAAAPSYASGPLRPVTLDAELGAVWWAFPRDRKLGDLGWLMTPDDHLRREAHVPGWRRTELAQYAPERSVTVRATDDRGTPLAYAKAYGPDAVPPSVAAARHARVAEELRGSGERVSAPQPLAWSDARRLLVLEAVPGRPWSALAGDGLADALGRLGLAVALLHDSTPVEGLAAFGRLRPDRVQHCADIVGRARPDVAGRTERLAARLLGTLPDPSPPVVLHGDCHPGNALVEGDAVALIDLDQLAYGPAAADLGSLVARLRYAATVGELEASQAADLEARFLAGYAARRPLPTARSMAWHTAAALLAERALRAVNRVNRPALARLDELVAAADAALDTGVHP
jgi:Ser/Thr protein kinase RdoA (MazF antagonist)